MKWKKHGLWDRYKQSKRLADKLWARWVFELLQSINQWTKWLSESPPLACGDLVNITDDAVRKSCFRGIVTDVNPRADGRIRQIMFQMAKFR